MLQLLLLVVSFVNCARILEHPEDVTVLLGEPATLQCRVSDGDVAWYKDGLKMRLNANRNVVLLPDGSLFFLTTKNSDTGLYHCATEDEAISYPAALIVGTEEEGIIPTDTAEEDIIDVSDISIEIQDIPTDQDQEIIPLEVMTDAELSGSIYIISMVIVAILTIVIIIGAALIFNKIKKVNSNTSTSQDQESTAPMMYAVPRTLDTLDSKNILQYPPHYNYILQNEYHTPIHFPSNDIYKCVSDSVEKTSPTNSYHYASSNIIHNTSNKKSTSKYNMNSSSRMGSPKDNYNYFSC